MIRTRRPLNKKATRLADDDFYNNNPEMIEDGNRIPISTDEDQIREWTSYYVHHGGEIEICGAGGSNCWLPTQPQNIYQRLLKGEKIDSPKGHVFYTTTTALLVKPNWPLRGYYVYMDMDPTDKVDFGKKGPWWTDENGIPHATNDAGEPVGRIDQFALAWSDDSEGKLEGTPQSFVMIYDRDKTRLEQRRKNVEQMSKRGGNLKEYRVMLKIWKTAVNGHGFTLQLFVPQDKYVIDIDACEKLIAECNQAREEAKHAKQSIYDFIMRSPQNQAFYFHRKQIDAYLEARPRIRARLSRLQGNISQKTLWQADCDSFDKDLNRYISKYLETLKEIFRILSDAKKIDLLGQIDLVDSLADPNGDHELWRHEFLVDAYGFFSGTPYADQIFNNYIKKLLEGLSTTWDRFRINCKCSTCQAMTIDTTVDEAPKAERLDELGWKAKDLKVGTRTVGRLIDLMTKFKDNIGKAIAGSANSAGELQWYAFLFMLRSGSFSSERALNKICDKWIDFWGKYYDAAKKGGGTLEEWSKRLEAEYARLGLKSKNSADWFKGVSSAFQMIGAAVSFYDIFSNRALKWDTKTLANLTNASTDMARGIMGALEASQKGGLKTFFMAKGYTEEIAVQQAARISRWTRITGTVGGAAQVVGSYMTLSEAADKADAREFAWAAVQYAGADVAFAGLLIDSTAAGSPAGIVLNVVGGIVYLFGSAGEWITRPDDVARFLQYNYYLSDKEYWAPGEKEALERNEQKELDEIRHARAQRNWDRR